MERDEKKINDKKNKNEDKDSEGYRFGIGIDIIDQNILSGPDIERAVNGIVIPKDKDDEKTNET